MMSLFSGPKQLYRILLTEQVLSVGVSALEEALRFFPRTKKTIEPGELEAVLKTARDAYSLGALLKKQVADLFIDNDGK